MKMFKRNVLILSLLFVLMIVPTTTNAQYSYQRTSPSKMYVGGSFGMQFGSEDIIDVSPLIGFWVTPIFTVGVGLTYQHYSSKIGSTDYSDNVYGGRAFSRLYLMDLFYLHAEYEYLALEEIRNNGNLVQQFNAENFLVGGGYREWIAPNAFMSFTVLWNLNNRYENGSDKPIYRVGVGVGI